MIAVLDSGVANLTSVMAALERLGAFATVTSDPALLREAERVILPGVGSAGAAMRALEQKGLTEIIRGLTRPVLGICLGMQILFEASEESGGTPCLGVVPGRVEKLTASDSMPLPHMGWNRLAFKAKEHPLFCGIEDGASMYFVHSFAALCGAATLATCDYGQAFTALCGHRNFYGCQFHPERSGEAGARLLQNFIEMKTE